MAVLNAVFCMTCSWSMLVNDERGDNMEEAYSRAGLLTALSPSVYHSLMWRVPILLVVVCVLVLRCCECVCFM